MLKIFHCLVFVIDVLHLKKNVINDYCGTLRTYLPRSVNKTKVKAKQEKQLASKRGGGDFIQEWPKGPTTKHWRWKITSLLLDILSLDLFFPESTCENETYF